MQAPAAYDFDDMQGNIFGPTCSCVCASSGLCFQVHTGLSMTLFPAKALGLHVFLHAPAKVPVLQELSRVSGWGMWLCTGNSVASNAPCKRHLAGIVQGATLQLTRSISTLDWSSGPLAGAACIPKSGTHPQPSCKAKTTAALEGQEGGHAAPPPS